MEIVKDIFHTHWKNVVIIVLLFLLYSCGGTRKVDSSKTEHTQSNINIENTYSMGEKIVLSDVFTYTPLDITKPMIVGGKSYQNSVIKSDKSVSKEKYFKVTETKYIHTSRNILTTKTTDKTNYIYLWLGMFFILVVAVWLWFYLPKIKN